MLSLRPSQRRLLIPTFCMEDMEVMAILDMLDMEDMVSMVLDIADMFMASVLLMLSLRPSQRLLLIPTFCMEDMEVMAILDMLDMEDMVSMVLDIADMFMASVLLMLSLRPRLIPTFCMEDMEAILDMLDIEDMPDTHMVDMPSLDKRTGTQHQNGQCNHLCFLYQ